MINHTMMRQTIRAYAKTLLVAATPAFARNSIAYQADVNGVYNQVAPNVLRIAHYVNGVLQPPLIESASQNLAINSSNLGAAGWGLNGLTKANVAGSCIAGGQAVQFTGTNVGNGSVPQDIGSFNGQSDCASWIIENVSGPSTAFGIWNLTANAWLVFVRFNWTTKALTLGAGAGTFGAVNLGSGRYLVWCSAAGPNGSLRRISVYPVDTGLNTLSAIVHHAQLEPGVATPSSPIVTGAQSASRAADIDQILAASAAGYTRQIGSFVDDGFAAGMEVGAVGFTKAQNNGPNVVTKVTALALEIAGGGTVEVPVAGRSIAAGLPSKRKWSNVGFKATPGTPYVEEQYVPGPTKQTTVGPGGIIELTPMYAMIFYLPETTGPLAASRYADAFTKLFAPRTPVPMPNGEILRVRWDVGPFPSQLIEAEGGFSAMTVTTPFWIQTPNSI